MSRIDLTGLRTTTRTDIMDIMDTADIIITGIIMDTTALRIIRMATMATMATGDGITMKGIRWIRLTSRD